VSLHVVTGIELFNTQKLTSSIFFYAGALALCAKLHPDFSVDNSVEACKHNRRAARALLEQMLASNKDFGMCHCRDVDWPGQDVVEEHHNGNNVKGGESTGDQNGRVADAV
jgi:hypothetical protein